jgi:hypothetical protein
MIKAALLDKEGVYLRIDVLSSAAEITDRHLPQITECDLPPNRYKWIPDPTGKNTYGGSFSPLKSPIEPEEEKHKSVEKVLGDPVAAEFSDKAWKIRTNLIVASAIAVAISLANLRITADSSILGLKFNGLSDPVIRNGLSALIGYLLLHFCWVSWDSLMEWRLRITGTRRGFVTGMMWESEHADIPSDPRQSTLYNWWKQQAGGIGNLAAMAEELKTKCSQWESDLKARFTGTPDWTNISNIMSLLAATRENAFKISTGVEAAEKALKAPRIVVSLKRFDRWFQLFLRSQNLRWLVIDLCVPFAFAILALYLLNS